MKDFYRQKGVGKRKLDQAKNGLVIAKLLSFREWQGVYQADDLTTADQVIPEYLV